MYMRVLHRMSALILCIAQPVSPATTSQSMGPSILRSSLIAHHSPLRQAQEQVSLRTLREAADPEPANSSVALRVFRASADANGIFDHVASSRGRVERGSICQPSDELHLRKRSGSGGGEGASAGARESGSQREHFVYGFGVVVGCGR